jgi:hypothetical protein
MPARGPGYASDSEVRGDLGVRWAREVLNLRPLACEASALPLSYAPLCFRRSARGLSVRGLLHTAPRGDNFTPDN